MNGRPAAADDRPQAPDEPPVVIVLHGDDLAGIQQHIKGLKQSLDDSGLLEVNFTRFDGRSAREEDIHAASMAMPFLAPRRIVVLTDPLVKLKTKEARRHFLTMLESLPNTTALVLVIQDEYQGRRGWSVFREDHWLRQWTVAAGKRAHYQPCRLPDQSREMPGWIQRKAKERGGQFTREAANTLASLVGSDTLAAQQEIDKLLSYVALKRAVEAEDVERLCSGGTGNVFKMVDAIGMQDKKEALHQLHVLLEEQDAQGLFFMTVRQFRMLLQVRESIDDGGDLSSASSELRRLPGFILDRLKTQARRFSIAQLEDIYHRLLEIDEGIKNSRLTPELALDMLVAGIDR